MGTDVIKTVVINDETYLIKKFDALAGMQIIRLLSNKLLPLFNKLNKNANEENADEADDNTLELIGDMLASLTDADVENLMKRCLKVCSKVLPAGATPIMDRSGNYCVDGIEYDMSLIFRLCYEALAWGLGDFFGGKSSILNSLPSLAGSQSAQ